MHAYCLCYEKQDREILGPGSIWSSVRVDPSVSINQFASGGTIFDSYLIQHVIELCWTRNVYPYMVADLGGKSLGNRLQKLQTEKTKNSRKPHKTTFRTYPLIFNERITTNIYVVKIWVLMRISLKNLWKSGYCSN